MEKANGENGERRQILIGLLLIAGACIHWWLPHTNRILLIAHALFIVGNVVIADALTRHYRGFSLIRGARRRTRLAVQLLLVGGIFGIIFELYGHWLIPYFYFPYWSTTTYSLLLIVAYAGYALYLIETYLGVKAWIEKSGSQKKRVAHHNMSKAAVTVLGSIGLLGISAITVVLIAHALPWGSWDAIIDGISAGVRNDALGPYASTALMFAIPLCIWLVLEYVEYRRHERSMLDQVFQGNSAPLIAVIITGWVSGLIYELFNQPVGIWRYQNVPFDGITILGLPVLVVLAWPVQYLPLFSLYRIFFKEETEQLYT